MVLGLPDGGIGVAWPSMRSVLDRSVGELGSLALASMVPYLLVSALTGRTLARWGVRPVLVASSALGACGLAAMAAGTTWVQVVCGVAAVGAASGGIDGGVNAHLAVHGSPADLAFAHGTYGVGATAGPLAATAAVVAWPVAGWRAVFAALAVAALATTAFVAHAIGRDEFGIPNSSRPEPDRAALADRARGRAPAAPTVLTLGFAGVFPLLVATTPSRVGGHAASRVVGWSIAGAALGGPSGTALVGVVADRSGPEAIAPALAASAIVLVATHLALDRVVATA